MNAYSSRPWEGLGGPIQIDNHHALAQNMIDPTLDICCQRDAENNLKASAVRRALQRHDVVRERERRRRHLVDANGFQGCRCLYDPQSDGGEYTALLELRATVNCVVGDDANGLYCGFVTGEEEKDAAGDSDDEFDYLLDDDLPEQSEEFKRIVEERRAELEMQMLLREIEMQHGYGSHRQMHPTRSLKAAGISPGTRDPPPFAVVHLFDAQSLSSASLDLYLEELASQMRGTKFIRSDGRMTLSMQGSLAEKVLPRGGADLPALIALKDGIAIQTCNINVFCGKNDDDYVVREAVHDWLSQLGVLHERPPPLVALCHIRPEEVALLDSMRAPLNEPVFFRCGVPGCQKTFEHKHIGVRTSEQSGLLVSGKEILGQEDA